MIDPVALPRRSPLRRKLQAAGAGWRKLDDIAVADTVDEGTAGGIVIADLTPFPRLGFKGRGTVPAMQARGIAIEATANRAFRQPDGGLCLVLAPGEVILLSNLNGDGERLAQLEANWRIEDEERTYPLSRRDSHAWLAVAGEALPEMFAKLCAIDLRRDKFADLAIAQTSIAKMSAILTRADMGTTPVFHLLVDSAAALYFCDCLLDAADEFGGRIVGLKALQKLAGG
ncbi:sarcosine oxidase [Hyphomicrobium sp. xq]|uniref:Sarcosine oxidase n=1 Tax=Hyphomicrobium album TaxID=2665159 RepID=A0A6I3KNT7_9HYPH|nr:sarcosine oxidase [Hyphomicrobium album]MTD95417.1 sarcosine oxidase [Hyphomicrobium album]